MNLRTQSIKLLEVNPDKKSQVIYIRKTNSTKLIWRVIKIILVDESKHLKTLWLV